MTLKNDANFKAKMNCGFKYESRIWWIFTQRLKAWIFLFDRLFLSKIHKVSATTIQRSYLSWHWTVMQNLNKPWPFVFQNGMRNWVNFHYITEKSETLYFDGLFLSKVYNVSARKFQKKYFSWCWRVIQKLKENWFVALKMT